MAISKESFAGISFLIFRLVSALSNNINDCDETYNYWEPGHYLLFGHGFQTWEYSPQYSIRSYAYLWLYLLPAKLLSMFTADKVMLFYATRIYLALVSTLCETFLFRAIVKKFNSKVAYTYLLVSLFSPGFFSSTTSFLPSSFGLYMTCLIVGFWLQQQYACFIFFTAFNAIVGWPFTAAISIPIALKLILSRQYLLKFIVISIVSAVVILIPVVAIDSYYYGKLVLPTLNILLYNVFSKHGPNLYGTEPFSFYLLNLFLNFNFMAIVSLASLPILLLYWFQTKKASLQGQFYLTSSLFLWYTIFFLQAHKEERFLYPIYPLVSLTAALSLDNLVKLNQKLNALKQNFFKNIFKLFLVTFTLLSLSRMAALHIGYSGSIKIYHHFNEINTETNKTLCLGKEWHRFPSHFFIPNNVQVSFIESEFRGQLPKVFDRLAEYPTRIIPTEMNDLNKEETSRYVKVDRCSFLIDSDYPEHFGRDLPYSKDQKTWRVAKSYAFLDSHRSSTIFRAFYVPVLSKRKCHYVNYNLLIKQSTKL